MDGFLWSGFLFDVILVLTVCTVLIKRALTALGILGTFLPFLWLIGAALAHAEGSGYYIEGSRP